MKLVRSLLGVGIHLLLMQAYGYGQDYTDPKILSSDGARTFRLAKASVDVAPVNLTQQQAEQFAQTHFKGAPLPANVREGLLQVIASSGTPVKTRTQALEALGANSDAFRRLVFDTYRELVRKNKGKATYRFKVTFEPQGVNPGPNAVALAQLPLILNDSPTVSLVNNLVSGPPVVSMARITLNAPETFTRDYGDGSDSQLVKQVLEDGLPGSVTLSRKDMGHNTYGYALDQPGDGYWVVKINHDYFPLFIGPQKSCDQYDAPPYKGVFFGGPLRNMGPFSESDGVSSLVKWVKVNVDSKGQPLEVELLDAKMAVPKIVLISDQERLENFKQSVLSNTFVGPVNELKGVERMRLLFELKELQGSSFWGQAIRYYLAHIPHFDVQPEPLDKNIIPQFIERGFIADLYHEPDCAAKFDFVVIYDEDGFPMFLKIFQFKGMDGFPYLKNYAIGANSFPRFSPALLNGKKVPFEVNLASIGSVDRINGKCVLVSWKVSGQ